jgi:hypothetical protein
VPKQKSDDNSSNVKFSVDSLGNLKSTSGSIGGWIIGDTTLKDNSGNVSLDSSSGTIKGAIIQAGELQSNSTSGLIKLDGYLTGSTATGFKFGELSSNYDDGRDEK